MSTPTPAVAHHSTTGMCKTGMFCLPAYLLHQALRPALDVRFCPPSSTKSCAHDIPALLTHLLSLSRKLEGKRLERMQRHMQNKYSSCRQLMQKS